MVCVYIDQTCIESNRPLKERNQNPNREWRDFLDGYCYGLSAIFEERLARALKETVQVITAGNLRINHYRLSASVTEHADKDHEKIVQPISKLLYVGVLVRGAFVSKHSDALVNDVS